MARQVLVFFIIYMVSITSLSAGTSCQSSGVWLQVLGSGGPELDDARASSSYVIWHNGKARVLVDLGGGGMLRFGQSGAELNDLDAILLSHLHVDHSNDLPALLKASFFTGRKRDLLIFGPTGNSLMPSTTDFVKSLFGANGAYRYLSDYIDGSGSYRLIPYDVDAEGKSEQAVRTETGFQLTAVPVHHGPIPALAWRVYIGGKSITFSGDMNNDNGTLAPLAKQSDILLAHLAIPEGTVGIAANLHMPPSVIGQIAASARVKQLVLSHRMNRTLGKEKASMIQIRNSFRGPLTFADDLQCFRP